MQIYNSGEQVTVCLKGDIDHHSVTAMRMEIDAVLESTAPKLLILDFSEVSFMDSSGIGLILGRVRVLNTFGGKILLKNPNEYIGKIIRLAGLYNFVIS